MILTRTAVQHEPGPGRARDDTKLLSLPQSGWRPAASLRVALLGRVDLARYEVQRSHGLVQGIQVVAREGISEPARHTLEILNHLEHGDTVLIRTNEPHPAPPSLPLTCSYPTPERNDDGPSGRRAFTCMASREPEGITRDWDGA